MWVALAFLSLGVGAVGALSVLVPLRFLGIRTRGRGALIVLAACLGFVIAALSNGAARRAGAAPSTQVASSPPTPEAQANLTHALRQDRDSYDALPNDLQRSNFERKADFRFCQMLREVRPRGWVGRVSAVSAASEDGYAALTVIGQGRDPAVFFSTAFKDLSPEAKRTFIPAGTPLYDALADLRVGQLVQFAGEPVEIIGAECPVAVTRYLVDRKPALVGVYLRFTDVRAINQGR